MRREEFEKNITQLLSLLKKIMKNHPADHSAMPNMFDQKHLENVVLNVCFFNFIPVSPEEMEELEEAFSEGIEEDAAKGESREINFPFEWNQSDVEFLRRHGMQF